MVRVDEITLEKAKYLKQVRLTPTQQAELSRVRAGNTGGFAGRHAWEKQSDLPVLRLAEEFGCNYQIAEPLVLADEKGAALAVLAIGDKWIGPDVQGATIYFGGEVRFF